MKLIKTPSQPSRLSKICLGALLFAPLLIFQFSFAAGGNGNSDGGGGDGLNNKVYESYIVDPMKLPAFKQIENLFPKDTDSQSIKKYFDAKTWYIAPVTLNPRSQDILGVTYIKNSPQPIATQTKSAVMIDSRSFYAPGETLQDQADIILHEMVEGIYLLKFIPLSELCTGYLVCSGGGDWKQLDVLSPPETPHALDKSDYDNIRFITGWIRLGNMRNSPAEEYGNLFLTHGFDKRLFSRQNDLARNKPPQSLPILDRDFISLLKAAEVTGNLPNTCTADNNESSQNCTVKFEQTEVQTGNNGATAVSSSGLKIIITSPDKGSVTTTVIIESTNLFLVDDNDQDSTYGIFTLSPTYNAKVGAQDNTILFMFKKSRATNDSPLVLKSILFEPFVVTKVDQKAQYVCQAQKPNPKTFFQHSVLLFDDSQAIDATEKAYLAFSSSSLSSTSKDCSY